ncbi:MAG: TIM barrel protein, partial [Pseudomonadota bacterium]
AADPDATQRFQYDMRRVFRYAKALKAQFVQILPGPVEGDTSIATLITNLRSVAQDTPQGQTLLLGALPFADGRFDYAASVEVIEAVNAPNLRLIFSTGLAQVMVKTLARAYLTLGATVGYVQLTDPPGKGTFEDQAGDMPALFETLRGSGYDGFISGSYAPNGPTENTLTAWRDLIR